MIERERARGREGEGGCGREGLQRKRKGFDKERERGRERNRNMGSVGSLERKERKSCSSLTPANSLFSTPLFSPSLSPSMVLCAPTHSHSGGRERKRETSRVNGVRARERNSTGV